MNKAYLCFLVLKTVHQLTIQQVEPEISQDMNT